MIVWRDCERSACPRRFAVPPGKPGRPRRWCSDECRRLASEERRAAEVGAIVTKLIVEKPTLDQCVIEVLASPRACVRVLRRIAELHTSGALREPKWTPLERELECLQFHLQPRRRW